MYFQQCVLRLAAVAAMVCLIPLCVSGADTRHPKTTFNLNRPPSFSAPTMVPSTTMPAPAATVLRGVVQSPNSPGTAVGCTEHDLQHYGSMGRQILYDAVNGHIFMVWTHEDVYPPPGEIRVRSQAWEMATGQYYLDPGGWEVLNDQSGFATCALMPEPVYGGSGVACNVDRYGAGNVQTTYNWDEGVYLGIGPLYIFYYEDMQYQGADWQVAWPIVAQHTRDESDNLPTENVLYVLSHTGPDDTTNALILYRRVGSLSESAIHFDGGRIMEECSNLSHIVVADPNSNRVAIVYTDDRGGLSAGEGGHVDLDVYYMISDDQGDTWSEPFNVSNYTEDSLWRAFTDLSALFTPDGVFHIVWSARELRDLETYEKYRSRLLHWDDYYWQTSIIDEARYDVVKDDILCDPGDWNLYIAKPSLSLCQDNLHVLYTKFGDDDEPWACLDCSEEYFANGELYLAASDDGGATWDTAWNITNTRSPHCDSAYCESEHWPSMIPYGIVYGDEWDPDTLDIVYVHDRDAGAAVLGEGHRCDNYIMHYRFPCRDVNYTPRASYEPNQFLDPTHTAPGVPLDTTFKIENTGNATLYIESIDPVYIDGNDWICIGYPTTNPIAPGDFAFVTIDLNCYGMLYDDPSGWDAFIIVDHDGPSDRDTLPVHLTVASDFNLPRRDTLRTTTKKLMVYNTGRLGGGHDGASIDIPGDCDADLDTPDADLYLNHASPMIAWNDGERNLAYTAIFDQRFTDDGTFRPQSDLMTYDYADHNMMICTLSTTDSLFGVGVTLYAPTDGLDFVIAKYDFTTWKPGLKGMNQVYVGMISDWDIPSDRGVANASGYDEELFTVYQRGAETSSADEEPPHSCPIEEDQRYGGITILEGHVMNAWTASNESMQFEYGMHPDSLFNRMSTLYGYNLYDTTGQEDDTIIDLHTGITFAEVDMAAKKTYSYYVVLATTNIGLSDYLAQVQQAETWAKAHGLIMDVCDCLPGDANGGGHIHVCDAVYLINWIFKAGPPPMPYPTCNGDANGDCEPNLGDVMYLAHFIFRHGPPPVTCEAWADQCGWPPAATAPAPTGDADAVPKSDRNQ